MARDTARAMSQEDVELVYQAHDAYNRRDLDGFLALMDSDVEFTPYERAIEGLGPYRGHRDVRIWWEESFEVLPDLTAEVYEVRDFGDRVFVRGRLHGHGGNSPARRFFRLQQNSRRGWFAGGRQRPGRITHFRGIRFSCGSLSHDAARLPFDLRPLSRFALSGQDFPGKGP